MNELALNILDIACNSTAARAKTVTITVTADTARDCLEISVSDDGCGMDGELLARVSDPFSTTRTTRKVGMGIPLFKMAAEMSGGAFAIASKVGEGTETRASFGLSHIDRMPLGSLGDTVATLIGGAPEVRFILDYAVDGRRYRFDTDEVKAVLDGCDIADASVLAFIKEMITENIENVNGGLTL